MRRTTLATALTAAAALALSSPAGAVERSFDHPKGGLSAPTDLHSTAGCLEKDVFVWPFDNPDGTSAMFVEVSLFDTCANEPVVDHWGFTDLATDDFRIDSQLKSAWLGVVVPMHDGLVDGSPATDPLTLDLAWTGVGRLYRDQIRYANGHADGVTVVNHDHETCRDATVSGTVTNATTDWAQGTASDARLCQQVGGSMFLFIEK
jgi:hypothetical protein